MAIAISKEYPTKAPFSREYDKDSRTMEATVPVWEKVFVADSLFTLAIIDIALSLLIYMVAFIWDSIVYRVLFINYPSRQHALLLAITVIK